MSLISLLFLSSNIMADDEEDDDDTCLVGTLLGETMLLSFLVQGLPLIDLSLTKSTGALWFTWELSMERFSSRTRSVYQSPKNDVVCHCLRHVMANNVASTLGAMSYVFLTGHQ